MRSFWVLKKSLKGVLAKYLIWTGPRLCPKFSQKPEMIMYYKKQPNSPRLKDRAKRSVSLFPSFQGSITVETTLVLPLFFFFCIQLISVISLFQLHSAITAALHQEVAQLSLQAYAYEEAGMDTDGMLTNLLGDFYLKDRIIRRVGVEYLDRSMIEGGSQGISVLLDESLRLEQHVGQDEIGVILTYRVKPVIDMLGFSGFAMASRCSMKAWTGYKIPIVQGEGEPEEELVYITESGTVYHKSKQCTHLALSIREAETDSLAVLRNEDGGKYYACDICGESSQNRIFLTDQGNRYHTSLTCSGLKRTIYVIKLSEVGGRGACSRCIGIG